MINFCIQTISYNSVINTFLAFYKVYLLLRERTDYVTPYVTVIIIGKCFVKGKIESNKAGMSVWLCNFRN